MGEGALGDLPVGVVGTLISSWTAACGSGGIGDIGGSVGSGVAGLGPCKSRPEDLSVAALNPLCASRIVPAYSVCTCTAGAWGDGEGDEACDFVELGEDGATFADGKTATFVDGMSLVGASCWSNLAC